MARQGSDSSKTCPKTWCSRPIATRLIQVLVNLLQNSLDALKDKAFEKEGPTIWIRAGRRMAG